MPWEGTKADRNYYYYFCSVEIIPYLIGTLFVACRYGPPLSAMVLYDLVWCQHGVSFSPLDGVKRWGAYHKEKILSRALFLDLKKTGIFDKTSEGNAGKDNVPPQDRPCTMRCRSRKKGVLPLIHQNSSLSSFTTAAAKSFAASGPFAVTILPSVTTGWPTSTAFPFFISITATGLS